MVLTIKQEVSFIIQSVADVVLPKRLRQSATKNIYSSRFETSQMKVLVVYFEASKKTSPTKGNENKDVHDVNRTSID
jgi:hypothetical protein